MHDVALYKTGTTDLEDTLAELKISHVPETGDYIVLLVPGHKMGPRHRSKTLDHMTVNGVVVRRSHAYGLDGHRAGVLLHLAHVKLDAVFKVDK